ncbi:hypothetical protein CCMSSC00406_0005884 [Pleurotus cornucopiae]|uniref:Uncharacterized protein n=1 Tax=Pleurotus cornucopiae TaxID=5321 RepID=A0ACB7IL07_PLECO|nr:hypothetical protein CCMSSC00406_0005884 [Pleurotus cornucopiae]
MYLACARAVVNLTIPFDNQPPIVTDYLTYDEDNICRALTLHRAYFRGDTATAVLLARGYDERWSQVWEAEVRNYDWEPLVDDYSGRIVERETMKFKTVAFLRYTEYLTSMQDDAQRTRYNR